MNNIGINYHPRSGKAEKHIVLLTRFCRYSSNICGRGSLLEIQVLPEKLKCPYAMNCVSSLKVLDSCSVREVQLVVKAPNFGVFIGNPFVHSCAVIVAPLDHEGSRGHKIRQFSVVRYIGEVEFVHVVAVVKHKARTC